MKPEWHVCDAGGGTLYAAAIPADLCPYCWKPASDSDSRKTTASKGKK